MEWESPGLISPPCIIAEKGRAKRLEIEPSETTGISQNVIQEFSLMSGNKKSPPL